MLSNTCASKTHFIIIIIIILLLLLLLLLLLVKESLKFSGKPLRKCHSLSYSLPSFPIVFFALGVSVCAW